jgi:endonuclease/exonuclease/phosphatase family metal-dependent hydrolase
MQAQRLKNVMKHITIATYNIRHGADVQLDWSLLAENILATGADLVGIQEMDMGTARVGGVDSLEGLRRATGLAHALFVPAMDFDGGQYGTAILSRYPLRFSEIRSLKSGGYEPRSFGCITVKTEDGSPFCFLNTHLSYESADQQNIQFRQLADWMDKHIEGHIPTVLTGDFNTEDFTAFAPITDLGFGLVNNGEHTYKTFRNPPLAIDNIVYRAACLTPVEHGMIDSDRSDHNLLWCRFEVK